MKQTDVTRLADRGTGCQRTRNKARGTFERHTSDFFLRVDENDSQ
jgi:hypothetical protein